MDYSKIQNEGWIPQEEATIRRLWWHQAGGGILEVQNFEWGTVGLPGEYSTFLWLRWIQRVVVSLAEALAVTKCMQA